jgi:hypothetical protein
MQVPKNLGSFKDLKMREARAVADMLKWEDQLDDCYEYCLPQRNLFNREDRAVADMLKWEDQLDDCYEYCLPQRNLFNREDKGQKKMDRIYDSTAIEGIQQGASKLQANIAPIWSRWANLEPSNDILRQIEAADEISEEDVRDNLEKQAEIMFDYINRSNFSTQFYEMSLDLLVGTGSMMIDEEDSDEMPIMFHSIPQISLAYEEGPSGKIETHWRRFKLKARNIERRWKGFEVKSSLREIITEQPDTEVQVTEGVVYDPKANIYWGVAWTQDDDSLSWVQSFDSSSSWVTGRYAKTAGEVRGRGPAMRALPDIKSLNKAKEFSLRKAAIDLSGMWTGVSDGIFNPHTVVVAPGVVIPVANNGQNPSLQRLDTGSNLSLAEFVIQDLQTTIKKAFFNSLREPNDSVISATQYADEARELASQIGSAFGRLQTEVLIPILQRVYWILVRRGLVTPLEIGGREVAIKFTSPLARTQDAEDLFAVQQSVEFTMMTAGEEAVQMAFKKEDFGTWAAKKTGMPQELVRNETEKAEVIQAGADAAREQMEAGQRPQEAAQ